MKITQEHYDKLASMISPLADRISAHREYLKAEGKAKDLETRLAWDCARAAKATDFICKELYAYLDDTHITTALKRIVATL